jgi:low temperature requirement protein LtrA
VRSAKARAGALTWLELFFDLVFVVAVAQLSNALSADKLYTTH